MNLVAITSIINCPQHLSVFTPEERLRQLIELTVPSIKKHIPNHHIVLLEGSSVTDQQLEQLKSLDIELVLIPVLDLGKSQGEFKLLSEYFFSDNFAQIRPQVKTFTKVSGRYYFKDSFLFNESNLIKKIPGDKTWTGHGVCATRMYRVNVEHLDNFIEKYQSVYLGKLPFLIDIEHCFYKYDMVPFDTFDETIHFTGNIAPAGVLVED